MALARDYNEWHLEELHREHAQDPSYVAGYLSACLEEGEEVFLVGLREVAQALGGMGRLATNTDLDRKHLYKMLSEEGNPTFVSISSVLHAFGIQLQCVPVENT